MKARVVVLLLYILAASTPLASQAPEIPLPEFYGIYLVADNKLIGVDPPDSMADLRQADIRLARTEEELHAGGTSANVPILPRDLSLLVFVKDYSLGAAQELKLRQLSYVRRVAEVERSSVQTVHVDSWVLMGPFAMGDPGVTVIELRFKPIKDQDDMVLAVPKEPLAPGLYLIGMDLLFAVEPIAAGTTSRCIDATRPRGVFNAWETRPCSSHQATSTSTSPETEAPTDEAPSGGRVDPSSGEHAVGFVVLGDETPVFGGPNETEAKDLLNSGTPAANAKGTLLGAPREFALEERDGRTHVVYLRERRMQSGWVDTKNLSRFTYDCSCKARCDPLALSLLRGSSWNECFEKALTSLGGALEEPAH